MTRLRELAQDALGDARGVQQLQPETLQLVEPRRHARLEGGEPGGRDARLVAALARPQRAPGREREDLGELAERLCRLLAHEGEHALDVRRRVEQVGLVHDQHQLLAPLAERRQERALGLAEGTIGGAQEHHEVGARHELPRQRLVLAQDRVGARRVDDRDRAQDLGGRADRLDPVARDVLASPARRSGVARSARSWA